MMRDWEKLKRLSAAEIGILFKAAALFPLVSTGVRIIGLKRMHTLLRWPTSAVAVARDEGSPARSAENIARLVRIAAGRGLARPTCLPRALVLWTLLRRHGFEARIRFGVRKSSARMEAHAWVELDGRVINEQQCIANVYAPLEPTAISGPARLP
ncbi:MAG: lasso peptide biosynthesis B2 protein [Gammaproteobacteria bacterium]|nr:lasso peptide biosynthesis B2 protein [Gammaproteobacteria bacterium]